MRLLVLLLLCIAAGCGETKQIESVERVDYTRYVGGLPMWDYEQEKRMGHPSPREVATYYKIFATDGTYTTAESKPSGETFRSSDWSVKEVTQ